MQGVANRTPILRNPAFASVPSRNPQTRSLAQSTFRGGFAQSGFAGQRSGGQRRSFGSVLGFVGPLFWPYAYNDFVDYTFSPYAYDTFWPYAYDDLYQGIYGTYAPQYYANEDAYAYAGTSASGETYANATGASRQRGRRAASTAGSTLICSSQAEGLTAFPIDRIAQQVELDQTQQALLQDLRAATANAVGILQAACPGELPSTPTGRLSAMRARVEAMLQTVQAVRPALARFYQSLSDEQKERFTAVAQRNPSQQQQDLAGLCGGGIAQNRGLPIDGVERELRLSQDQGAALQELNEASVKSAEIMKANCQPDQTLTATGRLAAMEERLTAMLQGLDQVQPALTKFYASLDDEQKARFDRLGIRPG
jgi:LTXXQ motif family protein